AGQSQRSVRGDRRTLRLDRSDRAKNQVLGPEPNFTGHADPERATIRTQTTKRIRTAVDGGATVQVPKPGPKPEAESPTPKDDEHGPVDHIHRSKTSESISLV